MPNTPTTDILDNAPPIGTHGTVTIPSSSGTTYVVLHETITPQWKQVEDQTAVGAPNRKRWVKDRYKLALTLQLSRASSVTYGGSYPVAGQTFTYAVQNESSSPLTFVVIETPEDRDNGQTIETAKITAEQVIGTISTS